MFYNFEVKIRQGECEHFFIIVKHYINHVIFCSVQTVKTVLIHLEYYATLN